MAAHTKGKTVKNTKEKQPPKKMLVKVPPPVEVPLEPMAEVTTPALSEYQPDSEPEATMIEPEKNKEVSWWALAGFLVVVVVITGVIIYRENVKKNLLTNTSSSPEPLLNPSPTPAVEVDKSHYSISVLNGSGKKGEAAKVRKQLEDEGFLVETIGNADNSTYKETVIRVKQEVPESFVEMLSESLIDTYTLASPETLSEESETQVEVIIGSQLATS